jgi:hypothetical protein
VEPLGKTNLPFIYTSSFGEDETFKKDATKMIVEKIIEKNGKFSKYPDKQRYSKKGLFIHKTDDIFLETPTSTGEVLSSLDLIPIKRALEKSIFDIAFIYLPTKIKIITKNDMDNSEYIFRKYDVENIRLDALVSNEYEKYKEMVE